MAPQELERSASQYASAAIKQDSQGARGMAITNYQKAIESLLKLQRLYPDSQLNKIYAERMRSYQTRIEALQNTSANYVEPVIEPKETLADNGKARFMLDWKPTMKIEDWIKTYREKMGL